MIVGGGNIGNGSEYLYTNNTIEVISFDVYDSPEIRFIADAHQIPLENNSVDGVIIQFVLEHVIPLLRFQVPLRPGRLNFHDDSAFAGSGSFSIHKTDTVLS